MSDIAQTHVPFRLRVRSSRMMLIIGTTLVVAITILVVALTSSGAEPSSRTQSPVNQTGGPNAAEASGAPVPAPAGGPNDVLRGQAAASASRH